MKKTGIANLFRSKLFYSVSAIAALLLLAAPGISSLSALLIGLPIALWTFKRRDARVNLLHVLAAGAIILCLAGTFLMNWMKASAMRTLADLVGLSSTVLSACIAAVLGILAFGMILTAVAACGNLMAGGVQKISPAGKKRISAREYILIFCTALIAITLFSKSSPFYPLNDWGDVNIFLTVGKSLLHGKTLYLDIYEQKGPLLFFIFVIPALISETSFIGVYLLEIISAFFFLLYSYKIVRLFAEKRSIFFLPIYAFIVYSTGAFAHGGSVEEFCLPMLTYSLYALANVIPDKTAHLSMCRSFIIGIFIGCILWIKYTMLGMYFGYALAIIILCIKRKQPAALLRTTLMVLLGIIAVSIPVFVYFAAHGALNELWTVYFYNNLFLYRTTSSGNLLYSEIRGLASAVVHNRAMFVVLIASFLALLHRNRRLFAGILLCFVTTVLLLYMRSAWIYYSFLLCAFMPFGYALLCTCLPRGDALERIGKAKLFTAARTAFLLIFCAARFMASDNAYLFMEAKADMPQYKMAAIINTYEDRSILTYGTLDVGLHTTTGTIPNARFFCTFNLKMDEMYTEQSDYIAEGRTNFIVTRNRELDAPNYTLIDTEQYYYEKKNRTYYLYKRIEE